MDLLIFVICSYLYKTTVQVESASTPTIFEAEHLPQNSLMASIGNGYVATNVYSSDVYVAGLFNGQGTEAPSHRARIPSTCDVTIRTNVTGNKTRIWSLDVVHGVFKYTETAENFNVEQRVYAHRDRQHIIVSEVYVSNSREEDISIAFDTKYQPVSEDIEFQILSSSDLRQLGLMEDFIKPKSYKAIVGHIKETEEPDSPRFGVAVVWTRVPRDPINIPKLTNQKWYFVTSISTSLDSKEFLRDAYGFYVSALSSTDELFSSHVHAWKELWSQGRIEVEGDLGLAQSIYGSLYYILSSIRPSWPHGLSPGGLASNGYDGHTFWDQETWMYPPLLLLFPDFARSCLEYRSRRLETAKLRAKKRSYEGAMFPWESAVTGNEVCPGEIYSDYEQHITADIAFATRQYWSATRDSDWLNKTGYDLIQATAEFWASRVTWNQSKDAYVIYDVMPPDEHRGVVNNSVYTNVVAKLNLEFASKIVKGAPKEWVTIATKMNIPFDKEKQYHPECDGYNLSLIVKQADVILLGFPLMFNMSPQVRINDLSIYEPRTLPDGPAMTKSMFAINWLDVGDIERAESSFKKSYANVQEPFKVWTETPGGGAVNFITGAGGFLQSVLFGYGGFRLHERYLQFKPTLMPNTNKMTVVGLDYLGNSIDVIIGTTASKVTVTSRLSSSPVLEAVLQVTQKEYQLDVGTSVVLPNSLIHIQERSLRSCLTCKNSGENPATNHETDDLLF